MPRRTNAVTKDDLQQLTQHLDARFAQLDARFVTKDDLQQLTQHLDARFAHVDARFAHVDAQLHKQGSLREHIDTKVQAGSEWLTTAQTQLQHTIDELGARLDQRLVDLEDVVRNQSGHVQRNSADTQRLSSEIAGFRRRFDQREDLEGFLERRVTGLEKQLGTR